MAKKKYTDSATMYTAIDRLKSDLQDARGGVTLVERAYNKDQLSEPQKRNFVKAAIAIIKALQKIDNIIHR